MNKYLKAATIGFALAVMILIALGIKVFIFGQPYIFSQQSAENKPKFLKINNPLKKEEINYQQGMILAVFKKDTTLKQAEDFLEKNNLIVVDITPSRIKDFADSKKLPESHVFYLEVKTGQEQKTINKLKKQDIISAAEKVYLFNDPQ